MQSARGGLVALALAGLVGLLLGAPAAAQTRAVAAERYDVDLTVQDGGALAVVQRLTLRFEGGPFRRGSLWIPLDRVEGIRDVRVAEAGRAYTPGADREYTYRTRRDEGRLYLEWWFPPTANTTREFEIGYRAEGALRVYPDHDQVYWQAIGADHDYPIRQARVVVHLPVDVSADQLKMAAYPERQRVSARPVDPRTVAFETSDLREGMGLTVRVQFPHGLIAAQPARWQAEADREDWLAQTVRPAANFVFLVLGLVVPVAGLVGLALLWRTRGRDPDLAPGAPVLSEPPSDLPAPLVGTLLDEQADVQDAVATLIDLANRGVLRLVEVEEPTDQGAVRDWEIERLTTDESGLGEHERLLLLTLLGRGNTVRLSQVRGTFAVAIPGLQAALYREVARAGLFVGDPRAVRARYRQAGWLLLLAGGLGAIFVGGWLVPYTDLAWLPFVGLALLGGGLLWLAPHMPQRTRPGALAAQRWAAFRRHLTGLAAGRDEAQRTEFERYLPYATAFGLDRAWIDRFAAVGASAPGWYQSGPVVVVGPGWGGYPGGVGPGWGGDPGGGWADSSGGPSGGAGGGHAGSTAPAGVGGPGGLDSASDSLADMLDRASDVFSSGGDSGWSGGGFGDTGGSSGGGGGGGSSFD